MKKIIITVIFCFYLLPLANFSKAEDKEDLEDQLRKIFAGREMNKIEGLWITRKDNEDENRIFLIVK